MPHPSCIRAPKPSHNPLTSPPHVGIRAVAVDIDGTVTDYGRLIDLAGIKALRAVEAQGIPVIPATGNVAPVTKAFANFVGLSGPLVCEGGGAVFSNDMKRKKLLFNRKRADRAIAKLKRRACG
jgi:hydroxymethylpyrimidine pyrophosphatase-like HAD family hydrolase